MTVSTKNFKMVLQHISLHCVCMVFIVAMSVQYSPSLSSANDVTHSVVDFFRYRRPFNDSSNLLYRLQVDLSIDLFAQARNACDFLYSDCDRNQRERCIHDALVTLRHEKVKLMLSTYSNEIEDSCDADILALGSIYDDFDTASGSPSTSHNVDVVCIVGSVANHSILAILHALAVKAVRLFIPAELMTDSYVRYFQEKQVLAQGMNKSLSVHVGDPAVELMNAMSDTGDVHDDALMCTILHLEDKAYSKDDLNHIVASLVASSFLKDNRHYSCWPKTFPSPPMRVVLMESKMYVPAMDDHSTIQRLNLDHTLPSSISMDGVRVDTWIHWMMSGMWYWQTHFIYSRYLDGFSTYAPVHNTTYFLSEISAGLVHVRCASEETRPGAADAIDSTTTCGESSTCEVREGDDALSHKRVSVITIIIIIITYVNRVFAETANGLKRALESIGYNEVSILSELTMSSHMAAMRTHHCHRPVLLQIAIGPHDLSLFSTNYLILHTEQPWFIQTASNFRYQAILANALCILVFSYLHAQQLLQIYPYACIRVIPMYSLDADVIRHRAEVGELTASESLETRRADLESREVDVLFLGGCSKRRATALSSLYEYFERMCEEDTTNNRAVRRCYSFNCKCVNTDIALFDEMHYETVRRAKVVLNINNQFSSSLEMHRLHYIMSMRRCIVTERGADQLLAREYGRALRFTGAHRIDNDSLLLDVTPVYRKIVELLSDVSLLLQCEDDSYDRYLLMSNNTVQLQKAMHYASLHAQSSSV